MSQKAILISVSISSYFLFLWGYVIVYFNSGNSYLTVLIYSFRKSTFHISRVPPEATNLYLQGQSTKNDHRVFNSLPYLLSLSKKCQNPNILREQSEHDPTNLRAKINIDLKKKQAPDMTDYFHSLTETRGHVFLKMKDHPIRFGTVA